MILDKQTFQFLESFPESVVHRGTQYHKDGLVVELTGTDTLVKGKVDDGQIYDTTLRLDNNEWWGYCTCPARTKCHHLYATMLEKVRRGESVESSDKKEEEFFSDQVASALERDLTEEEETYVDKVEKRFQRFELLGEIYDHDLVRLHPKWPVRPEVEPLTLWQEPPKSAREFWQYIAYALRKHQLDYPTFMEAVTDVSETAEQMEDWEREQEKGQWQETLQAVDTPKAPGEKVIAGRLRLMLTTLEGRLQWASGEEVNFEDVSAEQFRQLIEAEEGGLLELPLADRLLWLYGRELFSENEKPSLNLEKWESCAQLNRLLRQEEILSLFVNLDGTPFEKDAQSLSWKCRKVDKDNYELQLTTHLGEEVPHAVRALPGPEALYLSDEIVFSGPPLWQRDTLILPSYQIPREVLESAAGIAFLRHLSIDLPSGLKRKMVEVPLEVQVRCELSQQVTGREKEYLFVEVSASNPQGTHREILLKDRWHVLEEEEPPEGKIYYFQRGAMEEFPGALEAMQLNYDSDKERWRARVTQQFPERFTSWQQSIASRAHFVVDSTLQSLLDGPIKAKVKFSCEPLEEIDWFDLRVLVDTKDLRLSPSELRQLLQARGGFVRLENRGWMRLQLDIDAQEEAAISRLGLDPYDFSGEPQKLHVLQLADRYAQELIAKEQWEKICERANNLKLEVKPAVPKQLTANLRPYQIEGYHFLAYLSQNKFGGVLADDMGLGKTVQSLAWLLWLRRQKKKHLPSLVVCPKSVIDVWVAEAKKFAPQLRVAAFRPELVKDIKSSLDDIDLFIVNYARLRSSAAQFAKPKWLAVILDEGQQIKNPDSKAAQASRKLRSESRVVLTGTPIENRLLDVWSLMAFAQPGILGPRNHFRKRFDQSKDPLAQTRLSARLRPFLLRRTKGEVALDLPARTEEDVLCAMEGKQEELYQAELQRIQNLLLQSKAPGDLAKNKFGILQGLLRLRQICCHPGLVDRKLIEEESAKVTALFYLADQLYEEGHKVLIFSQFVTMLDILRSKLERESRPYFYLTGKTENRRELVEQFQTSKDPAVFLLSLKAAGSGLNLTAASYVILYDPWWNPAVEMQAIDRTHRIGQKNKVIAYRLLVRNSVEEKIRTLQTQKKALVQGVLGEESFAKNLQWEDLARLFEREEEEEKAVAV